jgi:uncharacterized membrane protein
MVMFTITILKFCDKKNNHILFEKDMGLCWIMCKNKKFMIIISCTCYKISVHQFCYMNKLKYYILFERFNFLTYKVYRGLMKSYHNFFVNVKIKKNVESPSCLIITNKLFSKPFKHFGEIHKFLKLWYLKYDLKILFIVSLFHTSKVFNNLPHSFPLCINTNLKPIFFWI